MIFRLLITVVCLSIGTTTVSARDIYKLIKEGRLDQANEALSATSTAALRDGNTLFFQSLLELDAAKSADLMEAALKTSIDSRYREELQYRLAQYYFVTDQHDKLHPLIAQYASSWENGRFADKMARYSALVDQDQGFYESALHQTDRYLTRYRKKEQQQWGTIDKARLLSGHNKRIGANQLLLELSRQRSGPGVPVALYQLAMNAIIRGQTDDAVFAYNLLREAYPDAVGLDALIDGLAGLPSPDRRDLEADRLTGTFYAVKVGVFSERSNAKKQADRFKQYGHKVEIESKTISDIKYRVVYVGSFDSFDEAAAFKRTLEAAHKEVFQVVAR